MTLGWLGHDDSGSWLPAYTEAKIIKKKSVRTAALCHALASIDQTGTGQLMKIAAEKGNQTRPGIKLGISPANTGASRRGLRPPALRSGWRLRPGDDRDTINDDLETRACRIRDRETLASRWSFRSPTAWDLRATASHCKLAHGTCSG